MTKHNLGSDETADQRVLFGSVGTNGYQMAPTQDKKFSRKSVPENVRRIVETIFGCKWSLTILVAIQADIRRPGAMTRTIEGLSTKVMNQCLSRLLEFNIVEKRTFAEIPPRVEYHITPFGNKFMKLFDVLDALSAELADDEAAAS